MEKRNPGIDLLRFVLMFMVCVLHVLGQGGILARLTPGTLQHSAFWFIEIFSYCAVDSFAIISGYVATNKSSKYEKLISLWFKVLFYSFFVTAFLVIIGKAQNIGKTDLITNLFPISFEKYWYMTAYFLLFLVMPIINNFIFNMSDKNAKKMFLVAFILFTFTGLVGDPFKTTLGYSAIWLILLYTIGLLAKKIDVFGNKKTSTLVFMWILSLFITWYSYVHLEYTHLLSYISPTILFNGLIMVILFKRLKLKTNIFSKFAPLALGIYLLQLNQVIWNNILFDKFVFILNHRTIIGVLYVVLFAFIMWIAGLVVESIRDYLAKILKINTLSNKLAKIINFIIDKMIVVLK